MPSQRYHSEILPSQVPSSTTWTRDFFHGFRDRMDSVVTGQAQPHRRKKKFVLCFDGTGNKFSGTDADSNILKIYRMLDRNDDEQFHYYQPGIGTYVVSKSLSHTSRIDRLKSWYAKAKDSAVGTSFAAHVMGGYKFLMRYYVPGDDIYLFGFSRGAYTARFLAEMLDHVGLLSAGNEEMCSFAWKTFQKWQCRVDKTPEDKKQKKYLLEYMCAFRETFSRPVKPIQFLGLFDTVNSVPRFENAWMQRSKFPYTARSSAKVIRHAVSIDERRAKFRQDLLSQEKPDRTSAYKRRHKKQHHGSLASGKEHDKDLERGRELSQQQDRRGTLTVPERYRSTSETAGVRNLSPGYSGAESEAERPASANSSISDLSRAAIQHFHDGETDDDDDGPQDITEVWFAGCHADIGGGWPLAPGEDAALSHVPLVWMVREAQRAGLNFDDDKLRALNCSHVLPDGPPEPENRHAAPTHVPTIEIDPGSPMPMSPDGEIKRARFGDNTIVTNGEKKINGAGHNEETEKEKRDRQHHHTSHFHRHFHSAGTQGHMHDVLQFGNGVGWSSVVSWNIMEYLPFRRMDLREDGSWESITWPLPKGETRDIPENATIHSSVIRRMEADPTYRPGNLIVGGGGRGVRHAPKDMGIGKWLVTKEEGDPVGECYVRAEKPVRRKTETIAPTGP